MLDLLLSVLWSFLVSIFAIPSIIDVSHKKKLFDRPNHRTVHELLTPRLGGLAIFAGFMSAVTIFGDTSEGVQQLLAGCLIIFFIGVKDDIITVSAFKKFFVQLLAAGIVMFIGDIRVTNFQGLLGIYELDMGISYGFTFLVIIGITNAINLIDGIDGLAGSVVVIIALTFGIYFYYYEVPFSYVAFSLAGAVAGFLRYNIYKAKIFMGDTGSLLCGFIISILAIEFIEMNSVGAAPALAVGILIIPIFDTLRVFALRIFHGHSPFYADKNHIHHKLLDMKLSHLSVVFTLIAFNIITIIIMVYYSYLGTTTLLMAAVVIAILLSIALSYIRKSKSLL
ncbi:MraY family glycosyltransferase [soil metagenome]